MFVKMYHDGLIYQGERIVNWCPRCHSTLADDEVEHREEKGKLYWIKYGPFILATSRPETKLGDTAVAVHPKDKRYSKLVDKEFMIKGVLGEFKIKVVADLAVDPQFGSGAIKVTPSHSFTDNEIAQRHNLPYRQIINEDGRMMPNCGKYQGLTTKEAREAIVHDMEKIGIMDHIEENYLHNLSVCYRCGETIEPIPSKQWFVAVSKKSSAVGTKNKPLSLKEKALKVVKNGEIKIVPDRFNKIYFHWIKNLHDWCISRQIWFGHRIPAWYCQKEHGGCGEIIVDSKTPTHCPKCQNTKLIQDPDTLDTWFSSGAWSFSTFYQKEKEVKLTPNGLFASTPLLSRFHPTSILETGYDILPLWVSRMILMTTYARNEVPFKTVYFHGLVKDKLGRKMSKSLGNGVDPVEMIQKYGADAVRLALVLNNAPGNDLKIYEEKINGYSKFITKIWNISRFILKQEPTFVSKKLILKTPIDHYLFSRFSELKKSVKKDLDSFCFASAGEKLKDFTKNEFADWYLEASKVEPEKKELLGVILKELLVLWHPFIPFVTEAIWSELPSAKRRGFLMAGNFPKADSLPIGQSKTAQRFKKVMEITQKIRSLRNLLNLLEKEKPALFLKCSDKELKKVILITEPLLQKLAGIDQFITKKKEKEEGLPLTFGKGTITIYPSNSADWKEPLRRLKEEAQQLKNRINGQKKKLKNQAFLEKAPAIIVQKEKDKLLFWEEKSKEISAFLG
jgi:valyl-tRNA synthetase